MNFAIAGPDGKPIPTLAKIDDPVAGTVYYLDLITQTAYRMHPPPLNPIPASGRPLPQNPAITGKNQNLGARSFEGLAVEGNLYTLTGTPPGASEPFSTTSETWVYRFANGEWPTTLLTKTSSPGVQQTNVLLHFSTAEPDPSLFRVPEGWNLLEGQPRERGVGSTRSGTSGAGARYNTVAGAHTSYDYVVQGVPYSAEEVTESGNRVTKSHVQSQPVKFYRDSSGRTRVERPLPNPYLDTRPSFVFPEITDPVDGLVIVLDPAHRIAHRFALGHMDPEPRSQFFSPVSVRGTVESRKDLGTDTLEGVLVSGELRTWRTPAGANGNDREYSESTEDWYSTKLKRVILEKYHGIESEAVVRLTHVSPEEPDPALFEVPAGYQIIDEKAPVEITVIQP